MHKKLKLITLMVVLMLVIAGCADQAQFPDRENYRHPNTGLVIQIPTTWEKVYESDFGANFVDKEKGIAFNTLMEVGGLGYYNADTLADEVVETFENDENFTDIEVVTREETSIGKNGYKVIFESTNNQGQRLGTKAFIMDVSPGVRYYLLFTADKETYYRYDRGFDWIAQSFYLGNSDSKNYRFLKDKMPEGHPEVGEDGTKFEQDQTGQ